MIEAHESPVDAPHFLNKITRGQCFFVWSDQYKDAKKFNTAREAAVWAADNRLNCGFRVCEHVDIT